MKENRSALYIRIAAVALSALLLGSCTSGKKTSSAADSTLKRKPYCINVPVQKDAPAVAWYKVKVKKEDITAAFSLPSAFDVYEVDTSALAAFFSYALTHNEKLSLDIPMPDGAGCQPFLVADAGTAAEGLAAKYPDNASLKGSSPNNAGSDIRLNYGNNKMDVSVRWSGSTYIMAPVLAAGRSVYIIYDRANSTQSNPATKEQQPATIQKTLQTTDR